jgi:hypothetical protein
VLRLLVTANVVPMSPSLFTLMMEAIRSSEPSVLTRATRRRIADDGVRHVYDFTLVDLEINVSRRFVCYFRWSHYHSLRTVTVKRKDKS